MPAAGLGIVNRGELIANCAPLPTGGKENTVMAMWHEGAEDTCIRRSLRSGEKKLEETHRRVSARYP